MCLHHYRELFSVHGCHGRAVSDGNVVMECVIVVVVVVVVFAALASRRRLRGPAASWRADFLVEVAIATGGHFGGHSAYLAR